MSKDDVKFYSSSQCEFAPLVSGKFFWENPAMNNPRSCKQNQNVKQEILRAMHETRHLCACLEDIVDTTERALVWE